MKTTVIMDASGNFREVEIKTFLIVDDLPMMRTVMKNIISQLQIPCECLEASDGIEALRFLVHSKIDLVLLDWKMPNLSGIDFLKRTRGLKLNVPIIMVTGESDKSSVRAAVQAGISGYIVKPVSKEVLGEKLAKLGIIGAGK